MEQASSLTTGIHVMSCRGCVEYDQKSGQLLIMSVGVILDSFVSILNWLCRLVPEQISCSVTVLIYAPSLVSYNYETHL